MAAARRRKRTSRKLAELSLLAPQVIALRSARMMAAGAFPSASDRRELERMGTEKVQAFWESMNAMAMQMTLNWWRACAAPWTRNAGFGKVMEQGLAPVHRRAKANARRLSRRRTR